MRICVHICSLCISSYDAILSRDPVIVCSLPVDRRIYTLIINLDDN